MNQPIPQWLDYSKECVRLDPRPSRLMLVWWCFLHGLVVLSILISSLGFLVKLVFLAGIAAHALRRFPARVPEFAIRDDGWWFASDQFGRLFRLAPRSRCGGWWIRIVLEDSLGDVEWLLIHDQLPRRDWRALSRAVRGAVHHDI